MLNSKPVRQTYQPLGLSHPVMGSTRTVRIYEDDLPRIDECSELPEEASMGAKVNDVLNRLERTGGQGQEAGPP